MAVVWLALCMTIFLGMAALTVDQGFHLTRRAQAQRAADAAVLAGAYTLAQSRPVSAAEDIAQEYAAKNGYDPNSTNPMVKATVQTYYPIPGTDAKGNPLYPNNWIMVRVMRNEPRFFGRAFLALIAHVNSSTQAVGATAIAEFNTLAPMDINGGGTYGLNDGPATLSVFGPDARYGNGDYRSVKTLGDKGKVGVSNPDYVPDRANDKDEDSGYNFTINMPSNFRQSKVEIFDPDCYNAGNIADAATGVRIDELRQPWSSSGGGPANATTTRYRLYSDNGTPGNLSDDILIDEVSYGNDASTDMQWADCFSFNRRNYAGQNFRLNVMSMSGSSENGFNIRAGKKNDTVVYNSDGTVNSNDFEDNGTEVSAQGHMPMNFNRNGFATVSLGTVPTQAAGHDLVIKKFDTDVGAGKVTYTCTSLPGKTFTGVLAGDSEFKTDYIRLPADYTTGTWSASYSASLQDTSVWDMAWTGAGPGGPGKIKLVR